jgi:hypothetical protein
MIDVTDLQRQAWLALAEGHNTLVFRFKRPSGKDLEMLYPRQMFEENFDGAVSIVLHHLSHWQEWCDAQQVCPLKK